ncbi:uronyl 2-sulfotransferase a isoform X1 [Pristis pectinata]|uniref:uronyl 2-sulfotransferase a isoform X1 n=1 Tax=Pristis pectinata TaxID=685728 RepID=UPI00223CB736|nr:uronyl 2-sulfotransferase a isoform X1 [Pristis pectinata]
MGGGSVRVRRLMMVLRKLLKCSLRDYGLCLASVLLLSLASLCYQLNGGAPALLLELRKYLGNSSFLDGYHHQPLKVVPFPSQLVYNRVGKCGSRTVVQLLRVLAERNHFSLINSDIHNKTRLNKNEQMELINNISIGEQPYLYTRHVHFLNFTRFGLEQPVHINIIRDPINRFVSNYFFRRFGDWRSEQNHQIRTPGMKDEERYMDINDCILENYPECNNPRVFYIIPYFCGQHPKCRDPGEWALQRAKENMNENYLLVGILEELEDVLLLLERLLPHYFKDASAIYHSAEYRKLGNGTITVKKQKPSPEALKVLFQRMRYEYDFYNYVKNQFHLLKRKFGLKTRGKAPSREYITPSQVVGPDHIHDDDDDTWLKNIYG